jgi:arylsulfatase A-like enzyme
MYEGIDLPEPATLFDDYRGRASPASLQAMTIADHMSPLDLKLRPARNLTPEQLEAWNAAYGPRNEAFEKLGLEGAELVRWRYQRYVKDYLRCVAAVDRNLGRVLDWLDQHGLAQDTVVVYSSDQGFYLGEHGWYDKRWMYEESLRTPLVVRWPGVTDPGSVDEHLVQNIDLASTFLDVAGIVPPAGLHGRSLAPLLRGERPSDWRRSIYYHYYEFPGSHDVRRHRGVRTHRYKLIEYYTTGEWELFDLESDPHELSSVADDPAYASVRRDLQAELERLARYYGEPDPLEFAPLAGD